MGASPEVWLRGPVADVPPLLQPVAHALLQAREEVHALMEGFEEEKLWSRPAGVASVAFHLQHIAGVIDRLLTYARGEQLGPDQLDALHREGAPPESGAALASMLDHLDEQIDRALVQLRSTNEPDLLARREVGRARLPSTVIGLLFHAAEHTQRHVGQLLVTARIVRDEPSA